MLKIGGFSVVEFVISLMLLGIITAFCAPLGLSISQELQLKLMAHHINQALAFARNMALFYNQPMALSPLVENDWSKGMVLFIDNKTHRYNHNPETLIHQWQWNSPKIKVHWHGFYSDHYLLFSSHLAHSIISGHFKLENDFSQQINLVVNRLGRVIILSKETLINS